MMRMLFVDTAYWVARSNRRDQWHEQAKVLSSQLENDLQQFQIQQFLCE
jgi:predicted nucleic acid-binding protein